MTVRQTLLAYAGIALHAEARGTAHAPVDHELACNPAAVAVNEAGVLDSAHHEESRVQGRGRAPRTGQPTSRRQGRCDGSVLRPDTGHAPQNRDRLSGLRLKLPVKVIAGERVIEANHPEGRLRPSTPTAVVPTPNRPTPSRINCTTM